MKIYAISGLGADKRVFQYLNLDFDMIPINWIEPIKGESIEDYAKRLSSKIKLNEKFAIMGVSFGGLVAVEISKISNPEITILISSAETRKEIPKLYRFIGGLGILKILPKKMFDPPRLLARFLFGAKHFELLNQILNDTDLNFAKWAINELINWGNSEKVKNQTLKISGSRDKLIPPILGEDIIEIKGGQHFMIVDRANEISDTINENLRKRTDNNGYMPCR